MARIAPARRRRIKVRGGHLGPLLCWGVVFADIGTSIYYVPGILYGHFGTRSAIFVAMTLVIFVLLAVKYAEIAWRYPEGGGVVTVASRAIHPFVGLLGGLFILVDYYLTAALSALSGVIYLSVVAPALTPIVLHATVVALLALGVLNAIGIKESARASALFALVAASGQLLVVLFVAARLGPAGIVDSFRALGRGPSLNPGLVITGYAAAFLAFSGLESIAQIAPAMREPRNRVSFRAMALVVVTMAITSPLLTLWSTTTLGRGDDPNQFISILGAHVAGPLLGDLVAVSGALLLVFASNTAIIGAYHVFIALTRMGFLPRLLEQRNRRRHTPHWAIIAAVAIPIGVVVAAQGSLDLLGDLYAFGLLGAFVLACLALDLVRWREGARNAAFGLGVLTTAAVTVAWCVNLVAKPLATEFGGGLTVLGLIVGFGTYHYGRRRRPAVFPVPYTGASASIAEAFKRRPAELLVVLPHDQEEAPAVLKEAIREAAGGSVVFLYRGTKPPAHYGEMWEVNDPYLKDYPAQDALARAETLTRRQLPDRRYVYVPGHMRPEVVADVWRAIQPRETVAAEADHDALPPIALERIRRRSVDGHVILHMVSGRHLRAAAGE